MQPHSIFRRTGEAVEGVFDSDFPTILLAQQATHQGGLELSQGVARDVVGDGQDHQRVQRRLQPFGRGVLRHQGIP